MKKFTQKFFLLTVGMILSVGASAQSSDGIAHRYPEFTFTATVSVKGTNETFTFTIPAWDAIVSTEIPEGTGLGYRLQLIENPTSTSGTWRARIVGSRVFSNELSTVTGDYWYASNPSTITFTDYQGNTVTKSFSSVTYGEIFGIYNAETNPYGVAEGDKNTSPFTVSKTTSTTDNLVIQKERLIQGGKWKNYTFKIVEIGEAAFRNTNPTNTLSSLNVTGTITIPNTIEKIENNAFRHGAFKKVVFEEGSQLTTIERATFEGNKSLEEVHIPASVTTIKGTAFGSCEKLNKVVFEGTTVPTFAFEEEEPLYKVGNKTMPEGGYNIFQGAFRLQTGYDGTTGKDVTPAKCIIEVPLGKVGEYAAVDNGLLKNFALSSKITLGDNGKMTYCSEEDFTVMQYNTANQGWEDGALKAYYVKNSVDDVDTENGKVYLTQITGESKIPGWSETEDFGVFFRGEANQSYSIFYPYDKMSTTLTMAGTTNCLKGVVTNTRITIPDPEDPEEEFSYFIFSKSTGNFRRITSSGTCQANKAYIKIKDGGNPSMGTEESKELAISFPEETGIATLETKSVQNDAWYTLQGVQVNQPQKGVFIKNGKKFVIK